MTLESLAADARSLPQTRWSLVEQAGGRSGEARDRALAEVLRLYLPALRSHVAWRFRMGPDAVEDCVQEFVAHKILERNVLGCAQRRVGRFRTFLLTCLDRFVLNYLRGEQRYRRHAEAVAERSEGSDPPAEQLDVAWARQVVLRALMHMERQCRVKGRQLVWTLFDRQVLGPLFRAERPVGHAELARHFGLAGPKQVSNLLVTAKRRYLQSLRRTVGRYCEPDEIDDEIHALQCILARSGA